ncbi:hypothetical protein [Streptosporangium carneum]|uniref:Uncharacterized protein n=1 Tax=Streptosporangium carneum TaxID=47481 RepID=A0A9W6I0Q7_9ACTN|nr:hypothetical protein [Streptosporangium carneum]GLK09562.1 hypothetical protein GCM10017600_29680 [Streptosporangium carneum]
MTDSPDEYGELLRRALSAEANSVVPSPDGLEIIRARIERRGLRGLMWWRVGASVAGAVLVAASVVMVVPQFRQEVIKQVQSGEVNYTVSAPPEMLATSRPPRQNDTPAPVTTRPGGLTPPPPAPTGSRSATPTPKPSAKPSRTPKPTPSPTCPTPPSNTTVEPEGLSKGCRETEPPAPEPSETGVPSDNPCTADECPPTEETRAPAPTEVSTPTPTGT